MPPLSPFLLLRGCNFSIHTTEESIQLTNSPCLCMSLFLITSDFGTDEVPSSQARSKNQEVVTRNLPVTRSHLFRLLFRLFCESAFYTLLHFLSAKVNRSFGPRTENERENEKSENSLTELPSGFALYSHLPTQKWPCKRGLKI